MFVTCQPTHGTWQTPAPLTSWAQSGLKPHCSTPNTPRKSNPTQKQCTAHIWGAVGFDKLIVPIYHGETMYKSTKRPLNTQHQQTKDKNQQQAVQKYFGGPVQDGGPPAHPPLLICVPAPGGRTLRKDRYVARAAWRGPAAEPHAKAGSSNQEPYPPPHLSRWPVH